jgi:hypothetical protein
VVVTPVAFLHIPDSFFRISYRFIVNFPRVAAVFGGVKNRRHFRRRAV